MLSERGNEIPEAVADLLCANLRTMPATKAVEVHLHDDHIIAAYRRGLAEREGAPVQPAGDVDDYVAWLCWRGNDSHRHLVLCDSDADGAFKVYRKPKGNREFIGTLRARLMAPFDCPWNGLVRDITAADETSGELCDPTAVMQALIASICERAYLDHSFPERQHSGLLGLFAQADKPRTPAERVRLAERSNGDHLDVMLDDHPQFTFEMYDRKHAERYAAGLRAELEKAQ